MTKDSNERPLLVLEVGADGGSLQLVATNEKPRRYSARMNDQSLVFIGEGEELKSESEWTSWEDAVRALSQYPWRQLYPTHVDPRHRGRIWELIRDATDLGGRFELTRWAELCGAGGKGTPKRLA